jgi:cytochrome o ubiquinol oxidase subunit 1
MLHNSLFLVAHFHNVIIGGVLFGAFAGYTYWFPKAFGFKLHEGLGKASFWFWIIGFYVTFMPLYGVGLKGMTRRMQHYDVPEWHPWLIVSGIGVLLITTGIGCQIAQLVVSIRRRESLKDETGDPWNGRTLEWATASPPPAYNFAHLPVVEGRAPLWISDDLPAISGLSAEKREVLLTTVIDAVPDVRDISPAPSVWPLIAAIVLTIGFIGSIFTPWAVVWGAIPVAIALTIWFWPKPGVKEDES